MEDSDGVIANLLDDSVPILPTFPIKLSKEQKMEMKRKRQEVKQAVKVDEVAERQQRDIEQWKGVKWRILWCKAVLFNCYGEKESVFIPQQRAILSYAK